MAKRMSNKERIQRKASEAAAEAKEKAAKKKTKTTKTTKTAKKKTAKKKTTSRASSSSASSGKRQKVVWKVYNSSFKEVASFPYPEKNDAEATATKLTKKSGQNHFVNAATVPMDEEA